MALANAFVTFSGSKGVPPGFASRLGISRDLAYEAVKRGRFLLYGSGGGY